MPTNAKPNISPILNLFTPNNQIQKSHHGCRWWYENLCFFFIFLCFPLKFTCIDCMYFDIQGCLVLGIILLLGDYFFCNAYFWKILFLFVYRSIVWLREGWEHHIFQFPISGVFWVSGGLPEERKKKKCRWLEKSCQRRPRSGMDNFILFN